MVKASGSLSVPNAPCGVESNQEGSYDGPCEFVNWFLMHRVELKEHGDTKGIRKIDQFLMHRVELKEL